MKIRTDIDIDLADREALLKIMPHVAAVQKDATTHKMRKHNTGVYFHDMPTNPLTGMASVEYKKAEDLGYFKIDVLNVSLYKQVRDPDHLDALCAVEPDWSMLTRPEVISTLFHLGNHVDITIKKAPKSINELAMLLALIRPGKRHLANLSWADIEKEIWVKPADGNYQFKKSHSLGYAMAIIVQLNLLRAEAATAAAR
jgi:hypothetical protein